MIYIYKIIYRTGIALVTLAWILSAVSCLTFAPHGEKVNQAQQEAFKDESTPGSTGSQAEFVKTRGRLRREKVLLSNRVRCVTADDNNVWVATDRGVSRFSREEGTWKHYTRAEGLVSDDVLAAAIDGSLVWFATSDGVSHYDT